MKRKFPRLPDSELDVMMALWNGHPDMTRQEVEEDINRKKHLALTTVLTMLSRLEKKQFVSVKKNGRTNLYNPLISREEYRQQESRSVLEKLYGNSLKNFVAALYRSEGIRREDLEEMEAFLKELKQKGREAGAAE